MVGLIDVRGQKQRCDWLNKTIAYIFIPGTVTKIKKLSFSTNHSAVFHPAHQTMDFRQTTVYKLRWLTPPTLNLKVALTTAVTTTTLLDTTTLNTTPLCTGTLCEATLGGPCVEDLLPSTIDPNCQTPGP